MAPCSPLAHAQVAALAHVLADHQHVWVDIFAVRQWPGNVADINFAPVVREAKGLVHPSPGQGTRPTASFILAQGTALIFIHIFWKADGGSKPPGCDCGDMARVGEHTRPRVSSLAPSPKTFGCDRERWTQKVSGGGAGNSTRGRVRSCAVELHNPAGWETRHNRIP